MIEGLTIDSATTISTLMDTVQDSKGVGEEGSKAYFELMDIKHDLILTEEYKQLVDVMKLEKRHDVAIMPRLQIQPTKRMIIWQQGIRNSK